MGRRKNMCIKKFLVHFRVNEPALLFENGEEHSNHRTEGNNQEVPNHGIPRKTKDAILECLQQGYTKPALILNLIKSKEDTRQPSLRQLFNFIYRIKRESKILDFDN